MNQLNRRVLAPTALLAGLCPLVANSLHESAATGAQLLAQAATPRSTAEMVSVGLLLLGFASLVVVLAILGAATAPHSPALAGVIAISGAAGVAIKLAEAQTGIALRESADVLTPATAEVLVAVDGAGFTVYGFLLALAIGAAGLGLLRTPGVPVWLAWWATAMGMIGLLAAAIGIIAPGSYVPIPFVLLLLWLVALGLTAVRRPLVVSVPVRPAGASQ